MPKLKLHGLARGQNAHAKAGKVADHHQLGQLVFFQVVQVAHGLVHRGVQVFFLLLVLDQQHAGPKQIHKARRAV
jgi:hypothetical protein